MGGEPLEVAEEAERLALERHGAGVNVEVDGLVAPVDAFEQSQWVAADDAHRADGEHAALVRRDGEELLDRLPRRQPAHCEHAPAGADRQHHPRGKDGAAAGVRQRQGSDGSLTHHDARAREVERHVVCGAADQEQRAQQRGPR